MIHEQFDDLSVPIAGRNHQRIPAILIDHLYLLCLRGAIHEQFDDLSVPVLSREH